MVFFHSRIVRSIHELKIQLLARKMDHQVKTLIAKPHDLSSTPWAHIVEGENQFHQVILWPSQPNLGAPVYSLDSWHPTNTCKNDLKIQLAVTQRTDRGNCVRGRMWYWRCLVGRGCTDSWQQRCDVLVMWKTFVFGSETKSSSSNVVTLRLRTVCTFTVLQALWVFPHHRSSTHAWKRSGFVTSVLSEAATSDTSPETQSLCLSQGLQI